MALRPVRDLVAAVGPDRRMQVIPTPEGATAGASYFAADMLDACRF